MSRPLPSDVNACCDSQLLMRPESVLIYVYRTVLQHPFVAGTCLISLSVWW